MRFFRGEVDASIFLSLSVFLSLSFSLFFLSLGFASGPRPGTPEAKSTKRKENKSNALFLHYVSGSREIFKFRFEIFFLLLFKNTVF